MIHVEPAGYERRAWEALDYGLGRSEFLGGVPRPDLEVVVFERETPLMQALEWLNSRFSITP